jgi:flavodoxin
MLNSLVVYYTRTGKTKKVAEEICKGLNSNIEEIFDTKKRSGPIGYMRAGKDSTGKKLTEIKDVAKDPAQYDIVIIGTPVWAWNLSVPIRTYMTNFSDKFQSVAFFCTCDGNSGETFKQMTKLAGKDPVSKLELVKQDFKNGTERKKINKFILELKNNK